jgi:hypothetical protein
MNQLSALINNMVVFVSGVIIPLILGVIIIIMGGRKRIADYGSPA